MTFRPTVWLAEFLVNLNITFGTQSQPRITALTNGNFLVSWTDASNNIDISTGTDVIGQIFDPLGARIGGAFQLNATQSFDQGASDIAGLPGGGFVMVYQSVTSTGSSIRFSMHDASGLLVHAGSIKSVATADGRVSAPVVEVLGNGGFAVSWHDQVNGFFGNSIGSATQVFTNTGREIGIELGGGSTNNGYDVADLPTSLSGSFIFATSFAASGFSRSAISLVLGSPSGLTSGLQIGMGSEAAASGVTFSDVQVAGLVGPAIDPTRLGYVAVWVSNSGSNNDILFSLFDDGDAFVSQRFVTSDVENDNEPEVIGLADGGFFIVWDDDTHGTIEGQRYDRSGNRAGAQLVIASGSVAAPDLSLTTDGRILVSWTEAGDIRSAILDPRTNVITGTNFADVLVAPTESSTVSGLDGNDTLFGSAFADTIDGGSGNDSLLGQAGNDRLLGGTGNDQLNGGAGDDVLIGGAGADFNDGGAGIDRVEYVASAAGVFVNLATNLAVFGDANGDTFASIENVVGTEFGDLIGGNDVNNFLDGRGGNDALSGDLGNDTLRGGSGDDRLIGGLGADILFGDSGIDVAEYVLSAVGVRVDLAFGTGLLGEAQGDVLNGIENLLGSAFGDDLRGDAGANVLSGGAGNDVLDGRGGDDRLLGGDGNDTLAGGAGADQLVGGSGRDRADYIGLASGVRVNLTTFVTSGGDAEGDVLNGIEDVLGSRFADLLLGDATANQLFGAQGNDRLFGLDGNDFLNGGGGSDTVTGGVGNDTLDGSAGADTLFGGAGSDVFRFSFGQNGTAVGARDEINDFIHLTDRINLSLLDANTTLAGNQAFTFVGAGSLVGGAGRLRYDGATGEMSGDVTGDGLADFRIFLTNHAVITQADLVL